MGEKSVLFPLPHICRKCGTRGRQMREVPEWIADNPDQAVPTRVKLRIWEREGGRCHLTGRKIMPGDKFEYEHRIAICNGGEHRETNIYLALADKHREKTADDVAIKSKVARVRAKFLGVYPKSPFKIRSRSFDRRRTPA